MYLLLLLFPLPEETKKITKIDVRELTTYVFF